MTDISVTSRVLHEEQDHSYELVTLNTGASFKSWLSKCFGEHVLTKGQNVTVVDGSNNKYGERLISGQIISIRDHSIWVCDPDKKETLICYPHRDIVTPSPL